MNTMPVSQWYGGDHQRLDGLFRQFQRSKSADFAAAKSYFEQFRAGLEQHIVWEEEILFPIFEEKTGMRGMGPTEVMRTEHRQIKQHLQDITQKLARSQADTDADEKELLAVLGAHNQKEEQILYPAMDGLLCDAEREQVFARMEQVPRHETSRAVTVAGHLEERRKTMSKVDSTCQEVIEKSEWVAIATAGTDGPHLVGCWSHNVRALGIEDDVIVIPAWHYNQTEENLRRNNRVELLFASRQVKRPDGSGQGCCVRGRAELVTSGAAADAVKAKFPWARGALVVTVEEAKTQL